MTRGEFMRQLHQAGLGEIVVVEREPNGRLEAHSHPFESQALILAGEIGLRVDGREACYRIGDVFRLDNG